MTDITPGWQWSNPPDLGQVDTAYTRSGTSFAAAPATDPASLASGTIAGGDVVDGFLALDPAWFTLAEVDLDGALLKAMALADSVAFAESTTAIEQVLPSLRSSGISLLATGRAVQLLQAIKDNESFEAALQGGAAPRALNARDLLRGYRLDIWSARVGAVAVAAPAGRHLPVRQRGHGLTDRHRRGRIHPAGGHAARR